MTKGAIIVAGIGRCGTSLVMQMLHAAGVPTVGDWPAFERNDELSLRADPAAWRALTVGKAVKALDPQRVPVPSSYEHRIIVLTRNPEQQAKSMLKMAGFKPNREARRAMEHSVRQDEEPLRRAAMDMGPGNFLKLSFENIIHDPMEAATRIANHVRYVNEPQLDTGAMAACVRSRPATCLPYMLEVELIHA